ncbi:MAG TPA: ribosome-associated translation inhibitor RaiA [Gammaproteobacteria bacterium]|nr:ribosome-associated translation inhibitor RaiA [Gammaproteobacteria bacterium]
MNSVQVTFRDLPYSKALETCIQDHAEKLRQYDEQFTHCRVVVAISQNHKHQGKLYNVRVNLTVPGKEIVATRQEDEDIYVAIRDTFNALTRQLEDYLRKRRGEIKTHEALLHGFIVRLFPEENYGFIQGQDGNEYYFSATNVASKTFNQLAVGDTVGFLTESGNEGLQARRVTLERHNHVENF